MKLLFGADGQARHNVLLSSLFSYLIGLLVRFVFFCCEQQFAAFHWGVSLLEVDQKLANGIKTAIVTHTYHNDSHTLSPISYPWVPKELGEDDQISRVQGETHVGRGDGQNGYAGLTRVLELLAQLLSFHWWSRPINTDVTDILGRKNEDYFHCFFLTDVNPLTRAKKWVDVNETNEMEVQILSKFFEMHLCPSKNQNNTQNKNIKS